MFVSINKNEKFKKPTTESVIHNSVRALIIKFLEDEQPRRFSDITKKLKKPDIVVSRELRFLGGKGWVIKTGSGQKTRYILNRRMKEVNEYLTILNTTPDPDSDFYPLELDMNALASELYENRTDMEVEFTLAHLNMVIAGERIDGFEKSVKHLEKNHKLLAEIVRFMNFIVMGRAEQNLKNYKAQMEREGRDVNTREAEKEIFFKGYGKGLKPFKLIISWSPERYGYLESCPLGFDWKLLKTTKN